MGSVDEGLFRKEALERNFSPERLEEAVRINTAASRVGLLAMLLLCLLFAAWSLVGRIATRVEGEGVLLPVPGKALLEMQLYLPPASGKRVRPGMPVNIEIAGLPRERWGTLAGRVVSISDLPVSHESMLATLGDDGLASRFSAKAMPFVAVVELATDPQRPGAYVWLGGEGAQAQLGRGAVGTGKVTIEERAPVDFLLPFLRTRPGA